jgi:hypothetical protein
MDDSENDFEELRKDWDFEETLGLRGDCCQPTNAELDEEYEEGLNSSDDE